MIDECSLGDSEPATQRLDLLKKLPVLGITEDVVTLAEQLMQNVTLPTKARIDAVDIAAATCHLMDFLLTWNCKHIANAVMIPRFEEICREAGYRLPQICTPELLMERSDAE